MNYFNYMLIFTISILSCQYIQCIKIKKLDLFTFDKHELNAIKSLNETRIEKGLKPIQFNEKFMDIAQSEAERLARKSKIGPLKIDTNFRYSAYIFKIQGLISERWGNI